MGMTKPMGDGTNGDTRAEEINGSAVSDRVWMEALALQRRVPLRGLLDVLL